MLWNMGAGEYLLLHAAELLTSRSPLPMLRWESPKFGEAVRVSRPADKLPLSRLSPQAGYGGHRSA